EFCRRLTELPEEKKAGRRYRLPTEEEWEYACRAATTTPYYTGNTLSPRQANFGNNLGRTTPVGRYDSRNKFGLYDMHSNLYQGCEDVHGPYQADLRDPKQSLGHVMRGGPFDFVDVVCRSASRASGYFADNRCGFRVVLTVDPRIPQPAPNPTA